MGHIKKLLFFRKVIEIETQFSQNSNIFYDQIAATPSDY